MDDESGYRMVMPFTVVTSVGGPYDDEAFAAGWECGALDNHLGIAARADAHIVLKTLRTALASQVDLLAMKHGYEVELESLDDAPEWSRATFTKADD